MAKTDKIVTELELLRDFFLKNHKLCNAAFNNDLCDEFCTKFKDTICRFECKNGNKDQNIAPKIGFLGSFSSGKSSIINSILGREIIPVKVEAETCWCKFLVGLAYR